MRKVIFATLLLLVTAVLNATEYYVATNGNDSNPGTISQPWRTWQKGFSTISAGDVLYIRGGNYTGMYGSGHGVNISSRDGSSSAKITVMAYPGEVPVLDCSSLSSSAGVNFGILMRSCDHWVIKGLTVKNVREYNNLSKSSGGSPTAGWELGSCTYITLDQCIVTNCGNGFSLNGTVYDIKYINCDAYGNYDYYDSGGLANGFNGNVRGSSTITYEGCRAWSNSDDGWDNFGGSGYMTYKNCWAFRNGKDVPTVGNGDGFKLGYDASFTELPNSQRTLYNCISADNYLMGFDEGMDQPTGMDMALYNCVAYKNVRDYGFRFYKTTGTARTTLKNNISYGNRVDYQGRSVNTSDHNSWDAGAPTFSDSDFANIDMTQLKRSRKPDGSLPDIEFAHLASGSDMINAGVNVGMPFSGAAPDLGAFESGMGTPAPPSIILAYQSSSIKAVNPSQVEVVYNLTVSTTIVPSASSFDVKVNDVARSISSLSISGKNVYLTLSSPVKYGETVTLSYAKPSQNPLQCTGGTQAESISLKSVTNSLSAPAAPAAPAYSGSAVNNNAANKIVMTFGENLANIIPAISAFAVTLNGNSSVIESVSVIEKTAILTLSANLKYGDNITVSYTKPSANLLQSVSGGIVADIASQPVTNNILAITDPAPAPAPEGKISIYPNPAKTYVSIVNLNLGSATGNLRLYDFRGKLCADIKLENITDTTRIDLSVRPGFYVAQVRVGSTAPHIQKLIITR